jgi:upstream activation factor subunit UAF30
MGNSGFQFDKAILKHAESLKAEQLLQLAIVMLLAHDCYVSPYGADEAKRITAAAKLLKVDLKKLKAPPPPAPKRLPGKSDFMQPCQPDAALAAIVGAEAIPRTEVTMRLWKHIKKHGLQDAKERRMINADEKLQAVFGGKKRVSMFEMTKLINKHLTQAAK